MIFNPTPEHLVETRNWMFQACFIWSIWGGVGLAYCSECGAKFKISFCWGYLLCLASAVTWVYLMHEIPVENFSQDIQILLIFGTFPLVNSIYAYLLEKLNRPNFQLKSTMSCVSVPLYLLFWMMASPFVFPSCLSCLITAKADQSSQEERKKQKIKKYCYSRSQNKAYSGNADHESYRDLGYSSYDAESESFTDYINYWTYYHHYYLPSIEYYDSQIYNYDKD